MVTKQHKQHNTTNPMPFGVTIQIDCVNIVSKNIYYKETKPFD